MGESGAKGAEDMKNSKLGAENPTQICTPSKFKLISSNRIRMDDSIVNGPVKTLSKNHPVSDFDFDLAVSEAIQLADYLNSTVGKINIGLKKIKCSELMPEKNKDYHIENYKSSQCVHEKLKYMYVKTINSQEMATNLDGLDRVVLKGDELVYNLFYFKDESLISNRILQIDVPVDSFVIVNIASSRVESLNISSIEFVENQIDARNLLFNFLTATEINNENSSIQRIDGSKT